MSKIKNINLFLFSHVQGITWVSDPNAERIVSHIVPYHYIIALKQFQFQTFNVVLATCVAILRDQALEMNSTVQPFVVC